MKYFLIGTDERNKNPYNVNKNRAIDIRLLTRKTAHQIPFWNVVKMDFPREGFFPDIISSPCTFLDKICMEVVSMYEPDIPFKVVKIMDKKEGVNRTYFLPILEEVDCMSDKTQFHVMGKRVIHLVLNKEKIGQKAVFKVKGWDARGMVVRLDVAESIIRRKARGIMLEEIELEEKKE
ncbi:hypothetical protein D7X25_19545 [bacterium 1XD42-8]|jgi:hypothetical protein|nr:hypothetical protein D7X25_19545 [bacterium 1XD42-8]